MKNIQTFEQFINKSYEIKHINESKDSTNIAKALIRHGMTKKDATEFTSDYNMEGAVLIYCKKDRTSFKIKLDYPKEKYTWECIVIGSEHSHSFFGGIEVEEGPEIPYNESYSDNDRLSSNYKGLTKRIVDAAIKLNIISKKDSKKKSIWNKADDIAIENADKDNPNVNELAKRLNEASNYPPGTKNNPNSPWNQRSPEPRVKRPGNSGIKFVANGNYEAFWFELKRELWELDLNELTNDQIEQIAIDYDGNFDSYPDGNEDGDYTSYETNATLNDLTDEGITDWLNDNWPFKRLEKLGVIKKLTPKDFSNGINDFGFKGLDPRKWKNVNEGLIEESKLEDQFKKFKNDVTKVLKSKKLNSNIESDGNNITIKIDDYKNFIIAKYSGQIGLEDSRSGFIRLKYGSMTLIERQTPAWNEWDPSWKSDYNNVIFDFLKDALKIFKKLDGESSIK